MAEVDKLAMNAVLMSLTCVTVNDAVCVVVNAATCEEVKAFNCETDSAAIDGALSACT